jgi:hypothetical protein
VRRSPSVEGLESRALLTAAGLSWRAPAALFTLQTQVPTTLTLNGPATPVTTVQRSIFTAVVGVPSGSTPAPTGTVTLFIDGRAQLPAQPVNPNGIAGISLPPMTAGNHIIAAAYSGDSRYIGSSTAVPQVVNKATTTTMLSTNPSFRTTAGQPVFLNVSVLVSNASPGIPQFTGSVVYYDGADVIGVVPIQAGGTATLRQTFAAGNHTITAAYTGDANYLNSPSAHIPLLVTSSPAGGGVGATLGDVRVVGVQRFGIHYQPTTLVVSFNSPMDPVSTQNPRNYAVVGPGGRTIAVGAARYDAATQSVTLFPLSRLNLHYRYFLLVNGTAPNGLSDVNGNLLDGAGNGVAGTNFVTTITAANLGVPRPLLF